LNKARRDAVTDVVGYGSFLGIAMVWFWLG
jgi:hypothetical protein